MNAYHFGGGKSRWVPYAFLLPGLLLYVLIALGPSIATTFFAFTNATGIRGAPVDWVGLDNFKEFLFMGQASKDNIAALGPILIFCFFVTTIQFSLGLLIAVLVNQNSRAQTFSEPSILCQDLGAVIRG